MVNPEVVEAILYGCAIWTPLKNHNNKLRITRGNILLRILGAWCKSPNSCVISYKRPTANKMCEYQATVRRRRLLWPRALLRMGEHRFPKRVMSRELENAGKRGPGGKEK